MNIHPNTNGGGGKNESAGAFDQDEYNFDIARLAALPLEQQDIARKKLAEKYAAFGIKLSTIKKQIKEACDKLAADSRAKARKEREEKMHNAKVCASDAPAPLLKDALADSNSTLEELVFAINTEWSFCMEAGKDTVLHQSYDPTLKRNLYVRSTRESFKAAYENRLVKIGVDDKGQDVYDELGKRWLKNDYRRQYLGGVVFLPNGDPGPDYLNLWTGFSIKPKKGSWKKLRKHIWKVICKTNRKAFRYFLQWMASVLQHPERQGYAFIVMRGEKGAGKGIVAAPFLRILGSHSLHIFNAQHLIGRFNLHLQACVFIYIDEALYAGDRQHESILKGLVTETTIAIEGKFMNVAEACNFLHGMMASNSDWVVPAGMRERRFCVLDVSDEHANDHAYFVPIRKEMEQDGGDAAMMYDLLRMNISNFNPAIIPETEGLENQKRLSLPLEYKWFEDVLSRGYVLDAKMGDDGDDVFRWFEDVTTRALFLSYEEFVNKQRTPYSKRLSDHAFGKFMAKLGFTHTQTEKALDGGVKGEGLTYNRITAKLNERRGLGYHLGTLEEARARYAETTKMSAPDTPIDEYVAERPPSFSGAGAAADADDNYDYYGVWVDGRWVSEKMVRRGA